MLYIDLMKPLLYSSFIHKKPLMFCCILIVFPDSPVGHRMLLAVASSIRQFVMVWSESPIRVRPDLMLLFKSVEATSAFLCLNRTLALC